MIKKLRLLPGVGMKTIAFITSMEEPLGMMIGNSLEVLESVHCLQGKGPADVLELVVAQGTLFSFTFCL